MVSHTDVLVLFNTKTAFRVVFGNVPMKLRVIPPLCKNISNRNRMEMVQSSVIALTKVWYK